jgi:hypothetical protein
MKLPFLFLPILANIVLTGVSFGRESANGDSDPASLNVNSKYTVESVELQSRALARISRSLRAEIDSLVGRKFDPALVGELASKLRAQIHKRVTHSIQPGNAPEHIRVVFASSESPLDEEPKITKVRYHHRQGWTGGLGVGMQFGGTRVDLGVQSDADELLERYAGVNAGISQRISDRVRAHFNFETFHQQWNNATIRALEDRPDVPGIYRERFQMEPGITVMLTEDLSLTGSISLQHFETQFPAARHQAANALETTLRHSTRWRESDSHGQELDAGYNLRAATNLLDTDYVYTRHSVHANYASRHNEHLFTISVLAGLLNGDAPLFDRFSLGNTRTLRGWDKFDVAPLGGNRVVHGSVGYRYRAVGFFYDAGSIWDHGTEPQDRHSVGVTLAMGALRDGPYLTLAFPLRSGAIQPLFMMGMNF